MTSMLGERRSRKMRASLATTTGEFACGDDELGRPEQRVTPIGHERRAGVCLLASRRVGADHVHGALASKSDTCLFHSICHGIEALRLSM